MPKAAGNYPKHPLYDWPEIKRYLSLAFQEPQEGDVPLGLTAADMNDMQAALLYGAIRANQWAAGSGATHPDLFRISAGAIANDFKVNPGVLSDSVDQTPQYNLAGRSAILPVTAAESFIQPTSAGAPFIHLKSTYLYRDTLQCSSMSLVPNALIGAKLVPNALDTNGPGGLPQWWTVLSNSETEVKVDLSSNGGLYLTDNAIAGDHFYFKPSTPAAPRIDDVWLDIHFGDEIAAVEVTGDKDIDAELLQDEGGTDFEPSRRMAIRQAVLLSQGQAWFTASAADSPAADENFRSWEDSDGNQHFCWRLAVLHRTTSTSILQWMIADTRTLAGKAVLDGSRAFLGTAFGSGVLTNGTLMHTLTTGNTVWSFTNDSNPTDGYVLRAGDRWHVPSPGDRTGPDSGGTWANGTEYIAYIDENGRFLIEAGTFDPSDDSQLLVRVGRAVGGAASTLTGRVDFRRSYENFSNLLNPNHAGVFERSLCILAQGAQPAKDASNTGAIAFTDEGKSATYGAMYAAVSNYMGLFATANVKALLIEAIAGTGAGISFPTSHGGAGTDVELYGKGSAVSWLDMLVASRDLLGAKMAELRAKLVRAPDIRFVLDSDINTLSPETGTLLVPAMAPNLWLATAADTFDWATYDYTKAPPWMATSDGVYLHGALGLPAGNLPVGSGTRFGHIDLMIFRGTRITTIEVVVIDNLGTGAITLRVQLRVRNERMGSAGGSSIHDTALGAEKSITCTGGVGVSAERTATFTAGTDFSFGGSDTHAMDKKLLRVSIMTGGTWTLAATSAGQHALILGANVVYEAHAVGKPNVSTGKTAFFPLLHA